MRFNSMVKDNDRKKDYSLYIIIAIVGAFIVAFFLNIAAKLLVVLAQVLIKYWWLGLIAIFVMLILRKITRKKK